MSNTIDRTRSQKCDAVYQQTQDPEDKRDADRVFCLETAHAHAIETGSAATAACFNDMIDEIVDVCCRSLDRDVVVNIVVDGAIQFSAAMTMEQGFGVDITPELAASWLRDAADTLEHQANPGFVCDACKEEEDAEADEGLT